MSGWVTAADRSGPASGSAAVPVSTTMLLAPQQSAVQRTACSTSWDSLRPGPVDSVDSLVQ